MGKKVICPRTGETPKICPCSPMPAGCSGVVEIEDDPNMTNLIPSLRDQLILAAVRNGMGIDIYDLLNKGQELDLGICACRLADAVLLARKMSPKELKNP